MHATAVRTQWERLPWKSILGVKFFVVPWSGNPHQGHTPRDPIFNQRGYIPTPKWCWTATKTQKTRPAPSLLPGCHAGAAPSVARSPAPAAAGCRWCAALGANARWPVPAASLPPPPPPKKRAPDKVEAGPASGSLCCALERKTNDTNTQNLPQSEAADTAVIGIFLGLLTIVIDVLLGLKQNARCVKSPVSGLLLGVEIFMTWQIPSLKSLKLKCSCRRGR